jgi:hypothetical protein
MHQPDSLVRMRSEVKRLLKWKSFQCSTYPCDTGRLHFTWFKRNRYYCGPSVKEDVWYLYLQGVKESTLACEEDLKCAILRQIYVIPPRLLIPSELLFDAGLGYANGEWIDTWIQIGNSEIKSLRLGEIIKPTVRDIRLSKEGQTDRILGKIVSPHNRLRDYEHHRSTEHTSTAAERKVRPLNCEETYNEWIADYFGAGLDEYDPFTDEECFYSLQLGESHEPSCAQSEAESPPEAESAAETAYLSVAQETD